MKRIKASPYLVCTEVQFDSISEGSFNSKKRKNCSGHSVSQEAQDGNFSDVLKSILFSVSVVAVLLTISVEEKYVLKQKHLPVAASFLQPCQQRGSGGVCRVGQSTALVQTKISQLLDGLSWDGALTFMLATGWIPVTSMMSVIAWPLIKCAQQVADLLLQWKIWAKSQSEAMLTSLWDTGAFQLALSLAC